MQFEIPDGTNVQIIVGSLDAATRGGPVAVSP